MAALRASKVEEPFQSHWFDQPAGRMRFIDEGPQNGTPILLVHGTPSSSFEWRHVIKALSPAHRCIAPDHIGFGLSEKPSQERFTYHYRDHRANLEALLDHLKIGKFHLVVHDLGGLIALPMALDQPQRIASITVVQSWMWDLRDDRKFARSRWLLTTPLMKFLYLQRGFSAKHLVRMAWGTRSPLTAELHRHFLTPFPDAASRVGTWAFARLVGSDQEFHDSIWARRGQLPKRPFSVVWGLSDKVVAPLHLQKWRELVPHAKFAALTDVGHWPQEEAPEEVLEAIRYSISQ